MPDPPDESERWALRLERERAARKQAEQLLEAKSLELYRANQALQALASSLEQQVVSRTEELQQALRRAEAATEAKSQFLAVMSHEIRTPMNGILGVLQLLDLSPLNEDQRGLIALMRASGDALLVLINDILDLSKIEAGKLALERRVFALREELASTVALYQPAAEKKGLALRSVGLDRLPSHVVGDSVRLRQVLSNLLSNALKFTEQGGVTVEVRRQASPPELAQLELEVQDTGVGISEAKQASLFRAFSQGDASTTRQYKGTGLGLAICAQLCRAMGGSIEVESREGQGSRFLVRLALPVHAAPEPSASATRAPGSVSGMRVLIVDDNPVNRLLARALLGQLGISPHLATSGPEAIERARQGDLDAVLMDVQMPEMDGVEAAQRILGLDIPRQPRIIALTASAFDSDRERCLAAGMVDFVSKPFQLAELHRALASGG